VGSAARARRPKRVLDILGAAVASLLAFTAVPVVLVVIVGNPLAAGLGHAWRPLPRDALCLLVVAAWVAWAACCAQLLRAVVAHVRSGDVRLRQGSSVLDRVAARIAFGVLALSTFGAPLALSTSAGASTPADNGALSAITAPRQSTAPSRAAGLSPVASTTTYRVRPGDSLWRIADDLLGDGADWTALAALNLGRDVGDGERFVDPDQVREGWRLRVPAEAHLSTDDDPHGSARGSARGGGTAQASPRGPTGHLPELVALGLGSLACAALARRAGQRRRLGARFTGDPMAAPALAEGMQDTATLLQRFAGVPALHAFEAANCLLALSLDGCASGPTIRAICVSASGVTFHFAQAPAGDPPAAFVARQDGTAWHVRHDDLEGHDPTFPYSPVVLPVGENADGTWLVPLGPGDILPLLGEAAPALWRAARGAVAAWSWSETILVTEDPDDARLRAEVAADRLVARHVLFCGDPASLPPQVAARCAVVTMEPVTATDLTVLVDRRAATLHPMGQVVRPHLQSTETAEQVTALVATPPDVDDAASDIVMPDDSVRSDALAIGALSPGAVDVRLLTMTPRLDGLQDDLPPNRARRAVELVAYLALHQPDVITSDRLRTRVLGSSDADAASKTLFNTAYAARRAMGVDEHGAPLFPAGTRHGHYQLSPQVTCDVQRASALAAEAKAQSDPSAAIAFYRAALALVESEPLANALAGYAWWEGEGHGGRIAAVLVKAACTMATLASDAGLFDLARWGLDQARVVEPYSEALSRSAMELAAAEGDADRLRLEWRECQRRVDALDPGCSPSARTESLYGELSRRVLVGVTADGAATPDLPAAND
jgi:DNA-binding SARP family transcriptional activator